MARSRKSSKHEGGAVLFGLAGALFVAAGGFAGGYYYLNSRTVRTATHEAKATKEVMQAAVLGAGIMGGGIAYQAAYKGTPIIMKDIRTEALDLGMNEATKLLSKQVERSRMTPDEMGKTLARIRPTLNYGDFNTVDIIIEAVVENIDVKKKVLADLENHISDATVVASNTSSLSITKMATSMKHPERFVGMHFFNPVSKMTEGDLNPIKSKVGMIRPIF